MNYFLLDLWEQLTRQVCQCKHTKRHHEVLPDWLADRSKIQCMDWVFTGKADGNGGLLGCCQCLSYHKKELSFGLWFYRFKRYFFPIKSEDLERRVQYDLDNCHCLCGHTARQHSIGTQKTLYPLYPACEECNCASYDYEKNPRSKIPKLEKVE